MEERNAYDETDFPSFCMWKSVRKARAFRVTEDSLEIETKNGKVQVFLNNDFDKIEIIRSFHDGEKYYALEFSFLPKRGPSLFSHSVILGDFEYVDAVRLHSIYATKLLSLKKDVSNHGKK